MLVYKLVMSKETNIVLSGTVFQVLYSVLQDSQPLRGHEKEQREVFYFEI